MSYRFNVSKYRNVLVEPDKGDRKEISTASSTDSSSTIRAAHGKVFVKSADPGVITVHGNIASESVTMPFDVHDFDVSDSCLLASGKQGQLFISGSSAANLSLPKVTDVHISPVVKNLGLAGTSTSLQPIDLQAQTVVKELPAKNIFSSDFGYGSTSLVVSSHLDGSIAIWDLRSSDAVASAVIHKKVSKWAFTSFISENTLVTTGISPLQLKQAHFLDLRAGLAKTHTQFFDSGPNLLKPIVDPARNLVFFFGKGDATLHYTDSADTMDASRKFPWPREILDVCLGSPSDLNLMEAEIDRLHIATKSNTLDTAHVRIPRRHYLDFYEELFPDLISAEGSVSEWLSNSGELSTVHKKVSPETFSLDKLSLADKQEKKDVSAEKSNEAPRPLVQESNVHQSDGLLEEPKGPKIPKEEALSKETHPEAPVKQQPKEIKQNTKWSRAFLQGYTPMKPALIDLPPADKFNPTSTKLIQATDDYFVYPLEKPGCLMTYPLNSGDRYNPDKGILLDTGTTQIRDFEILPFFNNLTLAVAAGDGALKTYALEKESEIRHTRTLNDLNFENPIHVLAHPFVKNMIATISLDNGSPTVRFWNSDSGSVLWKATLPDAAWSAHWSPLGTKLALLTKKAELHVYSLHNLTSKASSVPSSLKHSYVDWLDDNIVLVSTLNKLSFPELLLVDSDSLGVIGSHQFVQSANALKPIVDYDTSIALFYANGERTVLPVYVQDEGSKKSFHDLPTFSASSMQIGFFFYAKQKVDTTGVQVMRGLRLTGQNSLELVSFSIPRARPEYFQDDIFVDTANRLEPAEVADHWSSGIQYTPRFVSLNTQKRTPLSFAPPPPPTASTRAKIALRKEHEENKNADVLLDDLYKKAQDDESEEEDVPKARMLVPGDDDF